MDHSSINLKWSEFSDKLLESLRETLSDDSFSDVTLVFEDETKIEANSTLLASISPVFKNFLKAKSSVNPIFFLFGFDSVMVKSLLNFVYRGETEISKVSLESFLSTAEKLKFKGLSDTELQQDIIHTSASNNDVQGNADAEFFGEIGVFNLDEDTVDEIDDNNIEVTDNDGLETLADDVMEEGAPSKPIVPAPTYETYRTDTKPIEPKVEGDPTEAGISCFLCILAKGTSPGFKSVDDMYEHEKVAHSRGGKSYKCETCGQDFHRGLLLTQHKRKAHSTNNADSNCCDICGKSFKTEKQMNRHRDFSHPVPGKTFKCRMCPKESLTKNASNVHYYQAHSEEKRKAFEGKI